MALSAAERSPRYREKKKKQGLYEDLKKKHREQQRRSRGNRTYLKKVEDNRRDALRKRQSRKLVSQQLTNVDDHSTTTAFASIQTFGKAMSRATKALPTNSSKKFEVVERVARKLDERVAKNILTFYERDDISWQAPGKRDTTTVKHNGKFEKLQRRHLLFNLRELHGLYQLEFPVSS